VKPRFPLHNSVIPGKVYSIRDVNWHAIGEMTAATAHEALRDATIEWGDQCRTAVISKVALVGVKQMRYSR